MCKKNSIYESGSLIKGDLYIITDKASCEHFTILISSYPLSN